MSTRLRLIALVAVAAFILSAPSWAKASRLSESLRDMFSPPSNVVSTTRPDLFRYGISKIAVLPFRNLSEEPKAGEKVANLFYEELQSYGLYKLIAPFPLGEEKPGLELVIQKDSVSKESLNMIYSLMAREESQREEVVPPRPEEREIAREEAPGEPAPFDAIVSGIITRYKNRDGNPLLVESPASVSYEIYMVSARDGAILWKAAFSETQEPLLDNLLLFGRFLRGRGAWQTSEELSKLGMERLMRTFPGIKIGR